ncbi:YncE family protein [Bacteroidota bacterium]
MKFNLTYIMLLFIIIISCIRQPDAPYDEITDMSDHGAYILCEGLFGQDNSSLTRYDELYDASYNNFLRRVNSKFYFGDTANDIIIKGDTTFIVVSTNKKIIVFHTITGKKIKEIHFDGNRYPRKIAMLNDSIAGVTDLYDHSFSLINTNSLKILQEHIATGPAPEGIAVYNNYLFVANSGFGDYLSDEPKAGTISILDKNNFNEISLIENVPNVIELKVSLNNELLYARYNHLPKYKDSVGGIVEYDLETLTEKRRWRDRAGNFTISPDEEYLYYVCDEGIKRIYLLDENAKPELVISNNTDDFWYSISISPKNKLWIGNSKNYQSMGEVLVFDINSPKNSLLTFPVGLNPNTIVFF